MAAPPLDLSITITASADDPAAALPAGAGVFVVEDDEGRTLALTVTSNLRRAVRAGLSSESATSRRGSWRELAARVRATRVGSPLEADWVYLELARHRLPNTFTTLLDRWPCWCLHIDPAAPHPKFVKCRATADLASGPGRLFGPFADKHAAQRAIEALHDQFDLCRYHHILVEAPNGRACAYKEMGRCPAPCDGTISLEAYRTMIESAMAFLHEPYDVWRTREDDLMREESDALDFEAASRRKRVIDASSSFARPAARWVGELRAMRLVAVVPSEHDEATRLVLIFGGRVMPWIDLLPGADDDSITVVHQALRDLRDHPTDLSREGCENLGLVCSHLFNRNAPEFAAIPLDDHLDVDSLRNAIRSQSRAARRARAKAAREGATSRDDINDRSLDGTLEPDRS